MRTLIMTLCFTVTLSLHGQEITSSLAKRSQHLGKLVFESPTEDDYREATRLFKNLDLSYTSLSRYAFKCQVESFTREDPKPSYDESLCAVDEAKRLERHVNVYHEVYDPELAALGAPDAGGLKNPLSKAVYNPAIPVVSDFLRVDNRFFKSADDGGRETSGVTLKPIGYFNPFSAPLCTFVQLSMYRIVKENPLKYTGLSKETFVGVSKTGTHFVVKTRLLPSEKLDAETKRRMKFEMIVGFDSGLPVVSESWFGWDDHLTLRSRTETAWTQVGKYKVPTSIGVYDIDNNAVRGEYQARLDWRFDGDVDSNLFEMSDLRKRFSLSLK